MEDPTTKLIREVGIYNLGGYDGCPCTSFAIQGVEVNVSCRKSSGMTPVDPDFFGIGIRVNSTRSDTPKSIMGAVAREVAEQVRHEGYAIAVRYCSWEKDNARLCVYCGKERSAVKNYLCDACLADSERAKEYSYASMEFSIPEAT